MSMDDKLSILVNRWIIDYYSRSVWKSFEENGTIDPVYKTIILPSSGSNDTSSGPRLIPVDDVELRSRLLIDFMVKVVHGPDLYNEGGGAPKRVLLEEALEILDRMLQDTNVQEFVTLADVARLKLAIRRQAVFTCCRADNFALAASVFVRLWTQPDGEREKDIRQHIAQVVSEKNKSDSRLSMEPYSSLIDETRNFLRKVMSSLAPSFLWKAAKNVYQKIEGLGDQMMTAVVKHEPGVSPQQTSKNTELISEDVSSVGRRRGRKKSSLGGADSAGVSRGRAVGRGKRSNTDTGRSYSSVGDDLDGSMDASEDLQPEGNNAELFDKVSENGEYDDGKRRRGPWSQDEEETLFLGVKRLGIGRWSELVLDFPGRTNVDIKDKWRTMLRQGKIGIYEKIHGAIAVECKTYCTE